MVLVVDDEDEVVIDIDGNDEVDNEDDMEDKVDGDTVVCEDTAVVLGSVAEVVIAGLVANDVV